ncbi:unnamed protein product, partial [Penicillium nalgiovense]
NYGLFDLASLKCCVGCVELWVCPSTPQKARSCSNRQPVEAWPHVVNTQFPNLQP